jgi:hypothetical protein
MLPITLCRWSVRSAEAATDGVAVGGETFVVGQRHDAG